MTEKVETPQQRWKKRNRGRWLAYRKVWCQKHAERLKAKRAGEYARDPEKGKARRRLYCKRHPDRVAEGLKRWAKKNPGWKMEYYYKNHTKILKQRSAKSAIDPSKSRTNHWVVQGIENWSWGKYLEMLVAQGHRCLVCRRLLVATRSELTPDSEVAAVDHDHDTGIVRGLLCRACNTSMGLVSDSPERLRQLADYLDSHAVKEVPCVNDQAECGGTR